MNKRLALQVGAAAVLLGFGASSVRADPPETLAGLSVQPGGKALLLHHEANFGGLFYSNDGGGSFRIHPGMAFTVSGARAGTLTKILGDGTVLVATSSEGLFASGSGCVKPQDLKVTGTAHAIALHPTDPNVAFIAMGSWSEHSGVVRRAADGSTMGLGASDKTREVYDVRVVTRPGSSEQLRIVTVATPVTGTGLYLRYSDDLGQTWTERAITSPTGATPSSIKLLGVKGGDSMVAVVALVSRSNTEADEVLVTTDDGASFTPYVTDKMYAVGSSVIAPDGRFFFADRGNGGEGTGGIWMAAQVGAPLAKLVDYRANCLGWDEANAGLYVCKPYELGRLDISTKAYCRLYQLSETVDYVCPLNTFPKPDDWSQTPFEQGTDQMCEHFCDALHYASSAVCSVEARIATCVQKAREYDQKAGYVAPPLTQEARCAVPMADAGAVELDAGPDGGAQSGDAGAEPASDAGEEPSAAGKKSDDGCSVGSSTTGNHQALTLTLLSMLAGVLVRRRAARAKLASAQAKAD